jgi:hypothetical protein
VTFIQAQLPRWGCHHANHSPLLPRQQRIHRGLVYFSSVPFSILLQHPHIHQLLDVPHLSIIANDRKLPDFGFSIAYFT